MLCDGNDIILRGFVVGCREASVFLFKPCLLTFQEFVYALVEACTFVSGDCRVWH